MHLLQHFHTLTKEPKNAKELKGLILQLAVQGKLTAQWRAENPDQEPATELLKRIAKEKAELVEAKKIRKEKPLLAISEEEKPYELPEGWSWCRLGELTEIITKGSSPKWQGVQYVEQEDGILFITSENVGNYKLILKNKKYVEKKFNDIQPRSILKKNDILMNIVGGSIGRTAIFDLDEIANINQAVVIIRLLEKESLEYLISFFNSPLCISYMFDNQVDNARANLSMGNISKFLIALPPLSEQKAIVEVVEKLFKEVESLEELTARRVVLRENFVKSALAELATDAPTAWAFLQPHFPTFFAHPKTIKQLREAVLQLAVQGKLTTQWRAENPDQEPANQLLKRIAKEKAELVKEKKIRKEKPLPVISEEEKPYELPEGWVWCRLGEGMLKITDGTHHSPPNIEKGAFKYVSAKNIKTDGVQLSNITYVTKEHHEGIYARCNPELGDLLYIKDGATTGICCINDLDEEFSMLSSVALLKQPKEIIGHYLLSVLRSPYYYQLMRAGMSGVAITRVTLKKLKESTLPLPPLPEQKAIVAQVDALMSFCDSLEQLVGKQALLSERLMQSAVREVLA
jgi:type I restriction enzyme S subunit